MSAMHMVPGKRCHGLLLAASSHAIMLQIHLSALAGMKYARRQPPPSLRRACSCVTGSRGVLLCRAKAPCKTSRHQRRPGPNPG